MENNKPARPKSGCSHLKLWEVLIIWISWGYFGVLDGWLLMRGGSHKGLTVPANRTPTKRAIFIIYATDIDIIKEIKGDVKNQA